MAIIARVIQICPFSNLWWHILSVITRRGQAWDKSINSQSNALEPRSGGSWGTRWRSTMNCGCVCGFHFLCKTRFGCGSPHERMEDTVTLYCLSITEEWLTVIAKWNGWLVSACHCHCLIAKPSQAPPKQRWAKMFNFQMIQRSLWIQSKSKSARNQIRQLSWMSSINEQVFSLVYYLQQ